MHISKSRTCFNRKTSSYYFDVKTKILADFRICISVPLSKMHSASTPELTILWQVTIFSGIFKTFSKDENVRNKILFYAELHPYSRSQIRHISRMGIYFLNYWVRTTKQIHPCRLYFQHKIKASYFLPVWDILLVAMLNLWKECIFKKFTKFKT